MPKKIMQEETSELDDFDEDPDSFNIDEDLAEFE